MGLDLRAARCLDAIHQNPTMRKTKPIILTAGLSAFFLADVVSQTPPPLTTPGAPVHEWAPEVLHKAGIHVRRNINTLNSSEIDALRNGIRTMQSRPPSDPTSWIYQANIHGTFDSPLLPDWATCQHGTFFFLSWHRMYLYYFESILRAASG
jgi:hypothetical protein